MNHIIKTIYQNFLLKNIKIYIDYYTVNISYGKSIKIVYNRYSNTPAYFIYKYKTLK